MKTLLTKNTNANKQSDDKSINYDEFRAFGENFNSVEETINYVATARAKKDFNQQLAVLTLLQVTAKQKKLAGNALYTYHKRTIEAYRAKRAESASTTFEEIA